MSQEGKKISTKIRDEYGTMRRFCRLNSINYSSLRSVLAGVKVPYIEQALLASGIINDITELPQQQKPATQA